MKHILSIIALACLSFANIGRAQGTAFTYQGRLNFSNAPATGNYSLKFSLYTAPTNGSLVTTALTNAPVAVSNGLFTVTLDFGANAFTGAARWLEIGVRTNGSGGSFQTVLPRQPLTPSPYAVFAGSVASHNHSHTHLGEFWSGNTGVGLSVENTNGNGVNGTGHTGIYGESTGSDGNGIVGIANNGSSAYGVWGQSSSGYAGYFSGNVRVQGTLSKLASSFRIDHPLDPENKYLSHSFVESPDMKNIYDGTTVLNDSGEATVALPAWFEALNMDIRYQLTAIGAPGPNLYIAEEVSNNRFKIAGGKPGFKVSWQVTGTRQDTYAKEHRILVEEDKPKTKDEKAITAR